MTVGDFHVNDALAAAAELGAHPGYFAPPQFDPEWNVEENRTWLGPETLAQLPTGTVPDAVVAGVGGRREIHQRPLHQRLNAPGAGEHVRPARARHWAARSGAALLRAGVA
jgi:hypothetical protein